LSFSIKSVQLYTVMREKYKHLVVCFGIAAIFAGLVLLAPMKTEAAINSQINFQGKLTNPDGTNVTDGTYSIVFSIYTVPSGGAAVWTETDTTVGVASGIFQVALGNVAGGGTALPGSVNFNTSGIYLGVKVGSDAEMTPRVQFTAAPYAFNANQVGGISASGLVQLSPGSQQTGAININGSATIGNSLLFSSAAANSIQGAASQTLAVDSGSSGTLSLGTANASTISLGKFGVPVSAPGGVSINSGTNVPTSDQLSIDNTSSTGVTTAGTNGLDIHYKGGPAAVEASGMRVDYTPGTTSGGTWSGVRIVENTASASGVNSYGLKLEGGGVGAGTDSAIEVASGWDIGIDVQSGGLQLAAQAEPTAPTAGNLKIYARDIAGKILPKFVGPSGVDTPLQANLGFNRIAWVNPSGGSALTTCLAAMGSAFTNLVGCSNPIPTSTNLLKSTRRTTFTTTTTAGSVASHRQQTLQVWRGNAAGFGGFFYTTRFGTETLASGNRAFVGLADTIAAPTNVDPTTSPTIGKVGLAINANTGNWKLVNNTAASVPTAPDLGANFAVDTTSLYELVLFSAPFGTTIGYRVTNISTGIQTSGTLSTNLPANTSFFAPQVWITNNATAGAASISLGGWYLESDN
jgi:hypothetical protein